MSKILAVCPKCGREWVLECDDTLSIGRHGECLNCRCGDWLEEMTRAALNGETGG